MIIEISFQVKDQLPKHKLLIYTGPIDSYFEAVGMPKLEYRSVYFEVNIYKFLWVKSIITILYFPPLMYFENLNFLLLIQTDGQNQICLKPK